MSLSFVSKFYILLIILLLSVRASSFATFSCLDTPVLPETNLTIDELIAYNGYPVEVHTVVTKDGYILTLQRIPNGANNDTHFRRQPILFQHGFIASSANWIINLPNQSLGYILADAGYDIWLGNTRGGSYSQQHVNLTKFSQEFWDFSWDDMAEYDLPAMIDYILNVTNFEQIVYIAHSQGTLIGFAKFSEDLVFAKKIKLFIAFAPIATAGSITSPFKFLAPLTWTLQAGLSITGDRSFGDVKQLFRMVKSAFRMATDAECQNPFFYFSGPGSADSLNKTRMSLYLKHNPDDTSLKNFAHWGQMIISGLMQKYSYSPWTNYFKYGQLSAPVYHPENMEVETVIFWSPEDALTGPRDIQKLFAKLKNYQSHRLDTFHHNDFILSPEAAELVYPKIIEILNNCCRE